MCNRASQSGQSRFGTNRACENEHMAPKRVFKPIGQSGQSTQSGQSGFCTNQVICVHFVSKSVSDDDPPQDPFVLNSRTYFVLLLLLPPSYLAFCVLLLLDIPATCRVFTTMCVGQGKRDEKTRRSLMNHGTFC